MTDHTPTTDLLTRAADSVDVGPLDLDRLARRRHDLRRRQRVTALGTAASALIAGTALAASLGAGPDSTPVATDESGPAATASSPRSLAQSGERCRRTGGRPGDTRVSLTFSTTPNAVLAVRGVDGEVTTASMRRLTDTSLRIVLAWPAGSAVFDCAVGPVPIGESESDTWSIEYLGGDDRKDG